MREAKSNNAPKAMCRNSTEEKKNMDKGMKNKAKKAVSSSSSSRKVQLQKSEDKGMKNKAKKDVSKELRKKAEEALTELKSCLNGMLRLVKGLKIDSKEDEEGQCMRGSDG